MPLASASPVRSVGIGGGRRRQCLPSLVAAEAERQGRERRQGRNGASAPSGFGPRLQRIHPMEKRASKNAALRELGRIKRTLFTLEWLKSMDLRRRANAGLNKGEARNALAPAVFFYRLGETRDRSFESQAYRASGLATIGRERSAATSSWAKAAIALSAIRQETGAAPTSGRATRRSTLCNRRFPVFGE